MIIPLKKPNVLTTPEGATIRSVYVWASNGTTAYVGWVSGLSNVGSLQAILNTQDAAIFADLQASGVLPTDSESELAAGIQIYLANSGMKQAVFDKTMVQEDSDITAMLLILFPGNTAPIIAARTGMKQLLISSLIAVRVDAHERGLI